MPMPLGSAIAQATTGPLPFTRKAWDDPRRYKLNRAYGDEFEYASFAAFNRRWKVRNTVAGDFGFPGGSAIEWRMPSLGSAMYTAAPAGDFEAVLEFQIVGTSTNILFVLGLVDAVGTGAAGGVFATNSLYTWGMTAWADVTAGGSVASGFVFDNRHHWIGIKRVGTTLTARLSSNGTSFTSFTSGSTVSATAPYIALFAPGTSGAVGGFIIHRLNVYPGPAFFPG